MTAPVLFAQARGEPYQPGGERCFFCGASCGQEYLASQFVADSFTERNAVACPASQYVCGGCVACLRSDLDSVPLIDGTTQRPKEGKRPTLQVRWFSWVITEKQAQAATAAHRDLLLGVCLSPPAPPYAICIADGNRHQLYRTPVNLSRERIALNCEGTRVDYHPDELRDRLHLTMRLVAVCGKGGDSLTRLRDPLQDMGVVLQLARTYQDAADLYEQWRLVRSQPLTDLALWLTPGKDDCNDRLNTHPTALGAV